MLKQTLMISGVCLASFFLTGCLHGSAVKDYQPMLIQSAEAEQWPSERSGLSVMSINIRDLPKVVDKERRRGGVDRGRSKVAVDIGHRIAQMRTHGTHPQVVLLQEAFRKGASNVNGQAEYPHLVYGPSETTRTDEYPISKEFHDARSWNKGETFGTLLNSGLAILSDYPVTRHESIGFPKGMCAGYDCLASKGVLIAWIKVPDLDKPVAFVNIHMNSREPTGVSGERADEAYHHQIKELRRILDMYIDEETLVVIGGDLNSGQAPKRLATVREELDGFGHEDMLLAAHQTEGVVHQTSAEHVAGIIEYGADKFFARGTGGYRFSPEYAWVPFPKGREESFSDHAGFIVTLSVRESPPEDQSVSMQASLP